MRNMTDSYVWHDSFICVTWLIHMCDITSPYVWHDSFRRVTSPIHMCDMTHSYVWHDSFICVTWLSHTSDMTSPYTWHNSITCVTWLMHMCDMTHSYVGHDSFTCVTWLIRMCDMTPIYVWYDARPWHLGTINGVHVTHMNGSCHNSMTRLIHQWHMAHSYMRHDCKTRCVWGSKHIKKKKKISQKEEKNLQLQKMTSKTWPPTPTPPLSVWSEPPLSASMRASQGLSWSHLQKKRKRCRLHLLSSSRNRLDA